MVTSFAPQAALLLQQAAQLLRQGDARTAERILEPLLAPTSAMASHPDVLHAMGLVRLRQDRAAEAVAYLERSLAVEPRQPQAALNLGKTLRGLGRAEEAMAALRNAIKLKPDLADAHFELGNLLHDAKRLEEAESAYRRLLRVMPGHTPGKLALGAVLIDAGRPDEAEILLTRALGETTDPSLQSGLHYNLALAQRAQRKNADALVNFERVQVLDASRTELDFNRAELLQELRRPEEALAVYCAAVARDPANASAQHDYNDLLYRLGRDDEFLKSYDRAPRTVKLQRDKADFLIHAKRVEEAYEVHIAMLARDPGDKHAASGAATALILLKRFDEATRLFEQTLASHASDPNLHINYAALLLQKGDPEKAAAQVAAGLRMEPYNQIGLAMQGTAWRLMADERDEIQNGYDSLIRVFDLEPPDGFSDMAAFNEELCAYLDRLHPRTREYINQSLRGGSQTPNHLFGAGHDLVDRVAVRIRETVDRYIAELKSADDHPFLSRRTSGFGVSGSWSSRLADCGYHVNHLHPGGWISSCYYVGVPDAVKDEVGKQGWIKFGEPAFDVGLENPVRRAVQPVPGRLVLFPSYMWHGTVPFRGPTPRTTIAFDAVPE